MKFRTHKLVWSGVTSVLMRGAGAALSFLLSIVIARSLGVEGAGIYYLSITITTVATIVAKLGLDVTMLRLVAANRAYGNYREIDRLYEFASKRVLISSLIISSALFFGVGILADQVFKAPSLREPLKILAFSIIPLSLLSVWASFINGLGKNRAAIFIQSVGIPFATLLFVVLLRSHEVQFTSAIYFSSVLIIFAYSFFYWQLLSKENRDKQDSENRLEAEPMRMGVSMLIIAITNAIIDMTDVLLVGVYLDTASVAIYGTAAKIATMSSIILVAVNAVVGPKFSAYWAQHQKKELRAFATKITLAMGIVAALFLLMIVVGAPFIMKIYGHGFTSGSVPLQILGIGQFVALATGPSAYLLMMTGNEKFHRNNTLICAGVNFTANAMLIPKFGIMGAAIATCLSLSLKNVLGAWRAAKVIKWNT